MTSPAISRHAHAMKDHDMSQIEMDAQTASAPDAHGQAHAHDGAHHPHVMPMSVLIAVFGLLMVLTFLTVAATWVDLGALNVWIALGIALVKAAYVGLYFMHLRYDSPFNSMVLILSLLFVVLFIGITIVDTWEASSTIQPGAPGGPTLPTTE